MNTKHENPKTIRAVVEDVTLVSGKSRKRHNELSRLYWHVFYRGVRAGRAVVAIVYNGPAEPLASITVEINAAKRSRGIGTIVFRKASEMSGLAEIHAEIRKGNIASQIAAKRAGFQPIAANRSGELVMVWKRGKS